MAKKTTKKTATPEKVETKKTEPKKVVKKAAPKKPKFDLGQLSMDDLKVGKTVTINNERFVVLEGEKMRNKVTGEEVSY